MNTIDGSFRESIHNHPDMIAIRYYHDEIWEHITYSEMDNAVKITASGLMETGIGKESKVAIMSENRPEWIVCYLAAISAGAVAVPIDALLGEDESMYILNHSGAQTIICSISSLFMFLSHPIDNILGIILANSWIYKIWVTSLTGKTVTFSPSF